MRRAPAIERGDVVLYGKYLTHAALIGLGPDVQSVGHIDELGRDTQPVAGAAYAAL